MREVLGLAAIVIGGLLFCLGILKASPLAILIAFLLIPGGFILGVQAAGGVSASRSGH